MELEPNKDKSLVSWVLFSIWAMYGLSVTFAAINLRFPDWHLTDFAYSHRFFQIYHGVLVFLGLVAALFTLKKSWKIDLRSQALWIFIGLTFGALVLRLYHIRYFSLWLDEYTQLINSLENTPLAGAGVQHQMPGGYYFTYLGHLLFPWDPISHRLFPAIWGALSCGLVYLVSRKLTDSEWLSVGMALVLLANPWAIRYSQEGRPFAFGGVCSLIFLFSMLSNYYRATVPRGKIPWMIFSSGLLFLLSTGFQPMLYFGFTFLMFFLIKGREIKVQTFAVGSLVLILIAPIQFYVFKNSPGRMRGIESFLLTGIHKTFSLENLDHFRTLFNFHQKVALAFLVGMLVMSLYLLFMKREKEAAWISAFLCLGLPLILFLTYYSLINYPFGARYFYAIFIGTYVGLAGLISYFINKKEMSIINLIVILIGGIFIGHSVSKFQDLYFVDKTFERPYDDWKRSLGWIGHRAIHKDTIAVFDIMPDSHWVMKGVIAPQYYLPEAKELVMNKFIYEDYLGLKDLVQKAKKAGSKNIFVLMYYHGWENYSTRVPLGIEAGHFSAISTVKIPLAEAGNIKRELIDFAHQLKQNFEPSEKPFQKIEKVISELESILL